MAIAPKEILRKQFLDARNALAKEEIARKSNSIRKKLFSLPALREAKTIMFYVSFKSEVHTLGMIQRALSERKTVCVPYVDKHEIRPSIIWSVRELKPGHFGVPEPLHPNPISPASVDVVIVPGVAFDKKGFRIGYGKGFYDKFLPQTRAKKIGLCFASQLADKLPHEEHDVGMDVVITEKDKRDCRN
ncbi:5-formyltetrahydrofolate cyclo-ligase [Candidatus Woesearchaeota archaeon]|nr:5-formyltetrahydrofolate cyclo-ligase [Candidatus Woesearchaeota archaeon]